MFGDGASVGECRRPDRELETKLESLRDTLPNSAMHAAMLLAQQRALQWALGEEISLEDSVPGQCRDC